MKKYTVITTLFFIAAIILDVAAIIAFGSESNTALGSVFLSLGSVFLCLGTLLSRKQASGNGDNEKK